MNLSHCCCNATSCIDNFINELPRYMIMHLLLGITANYCFSLMSLQEPIESAGRAERVLHFFFGCCRCASTLTQCEILQVSFLFPHATFKITGARDCVHMTMIVEPIYQFQRDVRLYCCTHLDLHLHELVLAASPDRTQLRDFFCGQSCLNFQVLLWARNLSTLYNQRGPVIFAPSLHIVPPFPTCKTKCVHVTAGLLLSKTRL